MKTLRIQDEYNDDWIKALPGHADEVALHEQLSKKYKKGLRLIVTKGGPGSGHHGHAGRPGKLGGSVAGAGGTIGGVSKIMSDAFRRISNGTTELTITSSDDENYELQSYEDGDPGEAGEGYTPEEALENYISSVTGKSYTMSPDERDLCIDALNRLVSEGGEKTAQIWQEEGEDTYTAMIYNDGNPAFTGSGKTPLEAFIDLGVD